MCENIIQKALKSYWWQNLLNFRNSLWISGPVVTWSVILRPPNRRAEATNRLNNYFTYVNCLTNRLRSKLSLNCLCLFLIRETILSLFSTKKFLRRMTNKNNSSERKILFKSKKSPFPAIIHYLKTEKKFFEGQSFTEDSLF